MGALIGVVGALIFIVGYVWTIIIAFNKGGGRWGIICIFFPPITSLVFCLIKKTGWLQFALMILGLGLTLVSWRLQA